MAIFIKLDHPLKKIPIIFPNLPIPGLHGDFLSLELAVVDLRHAAAAHQGA